MRDAAGLDVWLAKGVFSKLPHQLGQQTLPGQGASTCFSSQKCSLRQTPRTIKATIADEQGLAFLGTEGMCKKDMGSGDGINCT